MNNNRKEQTTKIDDENYEYLGYRIKIIHDEDCQHPWDMGDCEPPYILRQWGGRNSREVFKRSNGFDHSHILSLAQPFFRANAKKIMDEFEGVIELSDNYSSLYDWCQDYSLIDNLRSSDQLDALEFFLDMAGIASKKYVWRGHCQGDREDGIMFVPIETWEQWHGKDVPYNKAKALESLDCSVEELKNWMSGYCYGFNIFDPDGNDTNDSCWGFIGEDPWKNGMFEHTHPAIEWMVEKAKKEQAEVEYWLARGVITTK